MKVSNFRRYRPRELVSSNIHVLEATETNDSIWNRSVEIIPLYFQKGQVGHETNLPGETPAEIVLAQKESMQISQVTNRCWNFSRKGIVTQSELCESGDFVENIDGNGSYEIRFTNIQFLC